MVVSWYYASDAERKGPVSRDELRLALIRGEIDRQSQVWCEGMPQWQALEGVEELQSLLEGVPPPLPHEPPPLPPQVSTPQAPAPPVAGGGASDSRDRASREPSETVAARMAEKSVGWLGDKIGNAIWEQLFGKQAVVFVVLILVPSVTVGAYYIGNRPPKVPMGQVRIDANPWGQIEWVRGPGGRNIDLPEVSTTPFLMTLPAGNYQVQIDYPHAQAPQRCDLLVQPDQVATCWLDLAPVDARAYFQQIGW